MHTQILTLPNQNRPLGLDSAIGQIDMLGGSGEVLQSWRIQSSKCTLGSGPECSVQIDAKVAAPLHATLVFGKKHTLLRAFAPIRIANRNVREWLIDRPTEIWIGDCRLVVHPSIAAVGTVFQAVDLIERAMDSNPSREIMESQLLRELDAVGNTWFASLSSQIQSQSDVQESLFSRLSEQFTGRLEAIDEQLHRFTEASRQHTSSLNEFLDHARGASPSIHHVATQDEQLAASLERAQLQIQQYTEQLQAVESERDDAYQKIAQLSACLAAEQSIGKPAIAEALEDAGVAETTSSETTSSEPSSGETTQTIAIEEDDLERLPAPLPDWFRKDETRQVEIRNQESEREAIATEDRDFARPPRSQDEHSDTAEEESIEEYMQRLLDRVRGTDIPPAASAKGPSAKTSSGTAPTRIVPSPVADSSEVDSAPIHVEPLTDETFVPRQHAPEHRDELDALRELANSNARGALSRSDYRRMNSAFFLKLGVTGVAVFSAVTILLLNGLVLNMSFVGMVAAVIIGLLWGYDCLTHFKRLQSDSRQIRDSIPRTAAMNAIQIGSTDGVDDRWRPSVS